VGREEGQGRKHKGILGFLPLLLQFLFQQLLRFLFIEFFFRRRLGSSQRDWR
jgi:hypothetical protein